jgi:hypothetical protein
MTFYLLLTKKVRQPRRERGSALISEFAAGLALLAICLVPMAVVGTKLLIILIVGQLMAAQTAGVASTSTAHDLALSQSSSLVNRLSRTGLARLTHLSPVSGFQGSGVDLSVQIEDKTTGQSVICNPNVALKTKPDCKKYEYNYRLVLRLQAEPLLPHSAFAASGLSCLTDPQIYNFTAVKRVEQPGGLCVCVLSSQGRQR